MGPSLVAVLLMVANPPSGEPSWARPGADVPELLFADVLVDGFRHVSGESLPDLAREAAPFLGGRNSAARLTWHGFGGPPFVWTSGQTCAGAAACRAGGFGDQFARHGGLGWTGGMGPLLRVLEPSSSMLAGREVRAELELGFSGVLVGFLPAAGMPSSTPRPGAALELSAGVTVERGFALRTSVFALSYQGFGDALLEAELFVGASFGWP